MRYSNAINEDVKALNHPNKYHKLYIISSLDTYLFKWTELLLINLNQFVAVCFEEN